MATPATSQGGVYIDGTYYVVTADNLVDVQNLAVQSQQNQLGRDLTTDERVATLRAIQTLYYANAGNTTPASADLDYQTNVERMNSTQTLISDSIKEGAMVVPNAVAGSVTDFAKGFASGFSSVAGSVGDFLKGMYNRWINGMSLIALILIATVGWIIYLAFKHPEAAVTAAKTAAVMAV